MGPVHPGEVLQEDFLKPLGMSVNVLAKALKVPTPRINDVVRKRRGVSADTAMRSAARGTVNGPKKRFELSIDTVAKNLQREDLLPQSTAADDVNGSCCPLRGFVHGDEGEVHGEFDAIKLHVDALIISIIAQIGFTGSRERLAVPVLDRRKRIRASGG
jgi:addiction module HigA family antidote